MPLIRLQLPNEFGLGDPSLYHSAEPDDPEAVLDGVAFSGLVGILRQLGDLAEFAADVFRDILEQVAVTTFRSNKMSIRIKRIDTKLTPIEKAVKAQKSHLHFAYTSGSDWHVKIRTKQKHLSCTELPQFIADSYEKCHSPPRLYLLDRFDSAGAGACLRRYSDLPYFETVCMSSDLTKAEKVQKEKEPRHRKRKGSRNKLGGASDAISKVGHHISDRLQFTSFGCEMITSRSSMSYHTNQNLSYDSGEYISRSKSSVKPVEDEHGHVSTSATKMNCVENYSSVLEEKLQATEDYDWQNGSLHGESILRRSSSVSWDEKTEIVTPIIQQRDGVLDDWQLASGSMPASNNITKLDAIPTSLGSSDQDDIVFDLVNIPESFSQEDHFSEATSKENSMDALHTLDSDIEKDILCQTEGEVELQFNIKAEGVETLDGLTHQMSDKEIVRQTEQEVELQFNIKAEGVETLDGLTHQMSDKEIVRQTNQEIELQCNVKAEGVEPIDVLTHQMSDKEIVRRTKQETELQCNVKAEGVETIDVLTHQMSDKEIVCQTKQETELQCNVKTEGFETIDVLTHQMSDKEIVRRTKQETELQCNVKAEGVETIDVLTHQMRDKEIVCQTKQETELQCNVKTEGVETIDVLTHQMSDKEIVCQTQQETELQCNVKAEGVGTIDVLAHQKSDKGIVCQTKQETELQCNVKAEGVETINVHTHQTSDKEIVGQTKQETELQCNVKAEGVETIDAHTHQTSDKEIVCQTKQETELQYNEEAGGVETIDVLTHQRSNLFSDSLNVDSPIFSYSSLDKELSPTSCPTMTEEMIQVEVTQPSPLGLNSNNLRVYGESSDFIGPSTTGGFETIPDDLPSWSAPSNLQLPKVADSLCESENCHITSDVPAVTIWTNGGLLGLEPSKPPDFSESDSIKKNHQKPVTAFSEKQPVEVQEVIPNGCFRAVREQSELPSNFSGFSDKFFRNSQRGKAFVTFHNASVPSNMESPATALKGDSSHITQETRPSVIASQAHHDAAKEEKFGLPSPPLEHIRISFHSASEASKMKLEFLSRLPERFQDVHFPSFHLLPEQAASFQANCPDSEDDTFCRSSQYLSDDALSPRSDLSSEQWEFRECDVNGDNELYDVFSSAPSVVSISSSLEFDAVGDLKLQTPMPCDVEGVNAQNEMQILESGSSLRSSGWSSLCSATREEDGTKGSLLEDPSNADLSYSTTDCTCEMPPSPPRPPLQRIIKSTSSSEDQNCILDTRNSQTDSHICGSITLELHMADVQQQLDVNNKAVTKNKIMYMLLDQPQLDDKREVHQIPNGSIVL